MGTSLLVFSISMFLIAAMGGLAMAIFIFKDRYPPFFLIGAHGFFGLGALALAVWSTGVPGTPSLVDFGIVTVMLGALGGIFLISFQFRNEMQPKVVVVLHALIAVGGVSLIFAGLLEVRRYARPVEWFTWVGH